MKTVVTGGAGFIGSNLARALLDQGREVVIADDFSRGNRLNLSDLGIQADCLEVDLRDFAQALEVIRGAETVFHLAARVGSLDWLHGSDMAELEALQTNLLIDTNTFRACIQNKVRKVIYASSVSVYPIHLQNRHDVVFAEDDCPVTAKGCEVPIINPEGGYGWSKLLGEIQLSWMKDIEIGIARIFNVYGENGELGKSSHVVLSLIRKAIRYPSEEFIVWGDGKQSRDFIYVADIADALIKLEEMASNPPVVVNLGGDKAIPIGELAEKIAGISGKDMEIKYDTSRPMGPTSRTADITRARSLLDWQPAVNLEEGLKRTYAWMVQRLQQR